MQSAHLVGQMAWGSVLAYLLCFPLCLTIAQCSANVLEWTGRKAKACSSSTTTSPSCRWRCCHFCHLLRMRPLSPRHLHLDCFANAAAASRSPPLLLQQKLPLFCQTLPSSFESAAASHLHPYTIQRIQFSIKPEKKKKL